MQPVFRTLLRYGLLALLAVPVAAHAQGWVPTRPVALVVGATPGGSLDLAARLIQRISETHKLVPTPIVVLNKAGAGQGLAWDYMQERGNDGHALSLGGPNLASNPIMGMHNISYRDITTIAILLDDYTAMVVRNESPLKSMRDAVERLRKDPGALTIGVGPALGGGAHLGVVVALKAAGVRVQDVRFVVYKSAGEAMLAAIGGELDIAAGTVANYPPQVMAKRIRVIGITAPKRLGGIMADAPTLRELGIDAVFTTWRSVIGPKGMARPQRTYWEDTFAKIVKTDEWQKDLERNFWSPNFLTGDAAHQFVVQQDKLYLQLFTELGMAKGKPAP
ncbi:MAG: Bug family tripartite tricarboxylate transporter substrate binding protein [Burkholderiales bacterium]